MKDRERADLELEWGRLLETSAGIRPSYPEAWIRSPSSRRATRLVEDALGIERAEPIEEDEAWPIGS